MVAGGAPNVAVTVAFAFNVTTQEPDPIQPPPLQLARPVLAVNVMTVPLLNGAEHVAVQLRMPAGFDETEPVPEIVTDRIGRLKLAVTLVLLVNVKAQVVAVPLQAVALPVPPLQPVKFDAALGVPVITMAVPAK